MTLEELSVTELNEVERRIIAAERNRGDVRLDARTARRFFEMATDPQEAHELHQEISDLEDEVDRLQDRIDELEADDD